MPHPAVTEYQTDQTARQEGQNVCGCFHVCSQNLSSDIPSSSSATLDLLGPLPAPLRAKGRALPG